jgi:glycyl-tRNA synthetase
MAFIVKKNIYGKDYYYLRQSVRENGKVVSKCLAYLGKTRSEAEKKAKEIMNSMKNNQNILDIKPAKKKSAAEAFSPTKISIEELANFCKKKGFVYRSSDIYGGFAGFWDYGPLGVELFKNIRDDWWNHFVYQQTSMVGIDASIISHPRAWKASGHIENFNINDYLVTCKKCKKSIKVDKPDLKKIKCPECGGEFDWSKAQVVEQMFKTRVGAAEKSDAYLRGETAQGMFMNFKLVHQTSRTQLPFGIAQVGRCFRNEIAPRDFLFRCREFHIGEFEFFIHPDEKKCSLLIEEHLNTRFMFLDEETQKKDSDKLKEVTIKEILKKGKLGEWHAYWLAEQIMWFKSIGLNEFKIREHTKEELSHYSSATFDVDYNFPFGSQEIAGNANRGQYDLTQHQKESKQSMEIFDEKTKKKVIPRVIEPTFGMDRVFLAILTKAYCDDKKRGNIVLRIPAKLAPIKAAVFPIVKQPEYEKIANEIADSLGEEFNVSYDKGGSIGRRYARNDEIGTPFCITVDGDSPKNKDATIRDRDTTKQIRVKISELKEILKKLIEGKIAFEEAGKLIS